MVCRRLGCIGRSTEASRLAKNINENWTNVWILSGAEKSFLIVHERYVNEATQIFAPMGVNVVKGHRHLGAYIGNTQQKEVYLNEKVREWQECIEKLAIAASIVPHESHVAFTKSLQHEWGYISRVMPNLQDILAPLETTIHSKFYKSLLDEIVSLDERKLFSLPCKKGGLGIADPTQLSEISYETSRKCTEHLRKSIIEGSTFLKPQHKKCIKEARANHRSTIDQKADTIIESLLNSMPAPQARAIKRNKDSKNAPWLTALPSQHDHFCLSKQEFRDAISVRYHKTLKNAPSLCDGCGDVFTLQHSLCCKKGGLVTLRHNEIRDTVGDLAALMWNNIIREPIIREQDPDSGEPALVADLLMRGVWNPQEGASFDIRVVDTDAPSYQARTIESVLRSAENEKKRKYLQACEARHITFTPLVISVDGHMAPEFDSFLRRLGEGLSLKWARSYPQVMGWIRTRLSFAVLRATNACIRSTRTKWRSLGIEDGASFSHST